MEKSLKAELPNGRFEGVSEARSRAMAAVRSRGNVTTERRIRALLAQAGIRGWKLHPKRTPGTPDFLFPSELVMVFVDGCFWHGCPKCGHVPKTNSTYWSAKINRNRRRDRLVTRTAQASGYTVVRIWECSLKRDARRAILRIRRALSLSALSSIL
jgi:DNA mismatch endonuclease Vsr